MVEGARDAQRRDVMCAVGAGRPVRPLVEPVHLHAGESAMALQVPGICLAETMKLCAAAMRKRLHIYEVHNVKQATSNVYSRVSRGLKVAPWTHELGYI